MSVCAGHRPQEPHHHISTHIYRCKFTLHFPCFIDFCLTSVLHCPLIWSSVVFSTVFICEIVQVQCLNQSDCNVNTSPPSPFSFHLQDQFESLDKHTQWGIDFLERYAKFVKERLEIEQNYAKQLRYTHTHRQACIKASAKTSLQVKNTSQYFF